MLTDLGSRSATAECISSSRGTTMPKSIIGDRIQQRLDELGISQAELARRCNLAQSTVNGLITGSSRSSAHLHVIARQLGVSTAWLAGVRAADDRGIAGEDSAEDLADRLGVALIPQVVLAELGSKDVGSIPVLAQVPFSREWLHEWAGSKERGLLFVTRGDGDDMAPTIGGRDLVLFDASETEIRQQDKLWAVCYGGVGFMRRVRRMADGGLELRADNPNVPPIESAVDDVRVIGRIVAVVRSV